MKFYSYDYMKSRINITDWLQLTIFVGLAILIGLAIWFYYHRNKDSKYRELAIIGIICFFILAGTRWQDAQAKQAAISQYSGASHLMEQEAEDCSILIRKQRPTEALSNPVTATIGLSSIAKDTISLRKWQFSCLRSNWWR